MRSTLGLPAGRNVLVCATANRAESLSQCRSIVTDDRSSNKQSLKIAARPQSMPWNSAQYESLQKSGTIADPLHNQEVDVVSKSHDAAPMLRLRVGWNVPSATRRQTVQSLNLNRECGNVDDQRRKQVSNSYVHGLTAEAS